MAQPRSLRDSLPSLLPPQRAAKAKTKLLKEAAANAARMRETALLARVTKATSSSSSSSSASSSSKKGKERAGPSLAASLASSAAPVAESSEIAALRREMAEIR